MKPLRIDTTRALPPSQQLVEALLDRIASGVHGPGERLPSVRALAAEALVNPNTVSKTYRELEALGIVEGRKGSGVFVTRKGASAAKRLRQRATRDALKRAFMDAQAAGHDPDSLVDMLATLAAARGEPIS